MLDERIRAFLCDRAALIVAFVGPDGRPRATRAWGLEMDGDDPATCRLLLERCQMEHIAHLVPGGLIAVTAADVVSFRSFGIKGRLESIGPVDEHDLAHYERHAAGFFDDIEATDRTPRAVLDRFRPGVLMACTFRAEQAYDQSPGPAAGRELGERPVPDPRQDGGQR